MAIALDRDKCIGCESCIGVCPVGALTMLEGKASIDQDKCISCGACVGECPVEAITRAEVLKTATVNLDEYKDIWVYVELEDGEPCPVAYELLAEAQALATKSGERCCAVLFCAAAGDLPAKLFAQGADVVYLVEGEEYADYNTELFAHAFCELSKAYKPNAVFVGATADGRDLAPRIAARLNTGLCADCTALDINNEKIVEWTRPAFGGNILATILCDVNRPQMGTVRPKVFKVQVAEAGRSGEVIKYTLPRTIVSRTELISKDKVANVSGVSLDEAEIICSGGRGMGSADNFRCLETLASLLGGAVGGSRAVVDEGWIGHPQQVGQSGKTVTPKVYFACGISGSIQHLAGMKDSKVIVAINKDEEAPINAVADYWLVGDLNTVVPEL
ncbi:MAG: FAD-binding protein, partial [Acidaminococcaceae bacterium]